MKKITLLLALLITGVSFGQLNQLKTQSQPALICGSGNFGEINYPSNYAGNKSAKYSGNSGIADTWTYTTQIADVTNRYQKSEIIFQNDIPLSSAVTSILSVTSVSGGGMTLADYELKIAGPTGVTTGNDPFCVDGSGNSAKIRFSLVKQSNFVAGGDPIIITLKATDVFNSAEETIIMTLNQPAILATSKLDNFNFTYGPNPASESIQLSANNTIEYVEIVSLLGQVMKRDKINSTNGSIDISNLSKGVYMMNVTIDGSNGTFKIIKE